MERSLSSPVETLDRLGNGQGFRERRRARLLHGPQAGRTRRGHRPARSHATPVQGDVAKPADLDRLYDQIRSEMGRVDVVFANAGGAMAAPLGSLTAEHIDYHLDVNVKGVIWTVQKGPASHGAGGSIILNASIVAQWAGPIGVSTAPLRRRSATSLGHGRRFAGRGIRVNAISPGVIRHPDTKTPAPAVTR